MYAMRAAMDQYNVDDRYVQSGAYFFINFKPKKYLMVEFFIEEIGMAQRRNKDEATRKILQMTVDGERNRGRPKLGWRDLVKEDMARNQMTTEMAEDIIT